MEMLELGACSVSAVVVVEAGTQETGQQQQQQQQQHLCVPAQPPVAGGRQQLLDGRDIRSLRSPTCLPDINPVEHL